jgi:hypothetical protein
MRVRPPCPCLGDAKKGTWIPNKITHCVKTNAYATEKLISMLSWTPVSPDIYPETYPFAHCRIAEDTLARAFVLGEFPEGHPLLAFLLKGYKY